MHLQIEGGSESRVTDAAVWSRPLSDEEVAALSGGLEVAKRRERAIWGEESPQLQYWRPRGYGTGVGDCMPFYHAGRFHLFYLFDRHSHDSKWGKGAHQWAHCSTTDLRHWDHHPLAIAITDEGEGSLCTGSVVYWAGIFYAFYTVRAIDDGSAPIMAATSTDGISFQKRLHQTFLSDTYLQKDVRDPMVFRDEPKGLFHMLVTTGLQPTDGQESIGCLAHLTSEDLVAWQERDTFFQAGIDGETDWNAQPECPDYFRWGDWYYLLFGVHGHTHYRLSRQPGGPWLRPKVHTLDGEQLRVIKTAAFTGNRRIAAGFVSEGHYAGNVVFREVVQNPDGSLGTAFVPELVPQSGPLLICTPQALSSGVFCGPGCCRIEAGAEAAAAMTEALPKNFRLQMRVSPERGAHRFGLVIGEPSPDCDGYELCFEPFRQRVGWQHQPWNPASEETAFALCPVEGLDEAFTLGLILTDELLDICINDRRTLVVRVPPAVKRGRLSWFAQSGRVGFSEIEAWSLS